MTTSPKDTYKPGFEIQMATLHDCIYGHLHDCNLQLSGWKLVSLAKLPIADSGFV